MDSAEGFCQRALPILFGPAALGALSQLYAGTSAEARGGKYYGPAGFGGEPEEISAPSLAQSQTEAARLWAALETLGGAAFR